MQKQIRDNKKESDIKPKFRLGLNLKKQKVYINMRKTHSNFFLTLTDCFGRVITTKSAAIVLGKSERRRRRKSPQTIEYMIASISEYLTFYNIWGIRLILHMRPGQYVFNLIKSLQARKIFLLRIFLRRKLPFSTTRGRRKKY